MDRNDIAISEWRDSKTRRSAATLKVALKAEGLPLFVLSLVIFYQNCFRSARRRFAGGLDLPSAPEAPFWPFAHQIGWVERFCEVDIEIDGPRIAWVRAVCREPENPARLSSTKEKTAFRDGS